MNRDLIRGLLEKVARGEESVDSALQELHFLPYRDLSFAKVDHHRSLRSGFPEVIFCQGKTISQVKEIFIQLHSVHTPVLATRATMEMYQAVKESVADVRYFETARCLVAGMPGNPSRNGIILIISAGTSDQPVAEEAAVCCEAMGNKTERLYDVGVAGIHRLLDNRDYLNRATVIIVVAGMEGALASVVGGLTHKPLIAVPTSIGYGASFGGLAALLAMLNSCASGISVVNIDNGFGAAAMANAIISLYNER